MKKLKMTFEERRADRLHKREFNLYLGMFGSHDRFYPFVGIAPLLSDKEYWEQVRDVWMMSEIIYPETKTWLKFFQSKRSGRELLMKNIETDELAAMPNEIKIWRGCGHKSGIHGMSWTTSKSRAKFFADYSRSSRRKDLVASNGKTPILVEAIYDKSDVLDYFTERSESEIILKPNAAKILSITELEPQ